MIKNPFKKEGKKSSFQQKESNVLIVIFILSALLGIILFIMTRKVILFALCMAIGITLYFLFSDRISEIDINRKIQQDLNLHYTFLESFYLFSSLNNSYWQGFKCAYDSLKLSHMKDRITDYLDNPNSPLDIHLTNSRTENQLIDMLIRFLHSEEETKDSDLEQYHELLICYQEECKKKPLKLHVFLIPVILSAFIMIFFVYTLINRGK
jgi:hypothetical protein